VTRVAAVSRGAVALRISLFYAALFLLIGVLMPFWPLWLEARGLSPIQIAILLAAGQWVKVASNPLIARLSDRHGETRKPLVVLSIGALASFALFAAADGFAQLLAVSILSAVCVSALFPLGDSLGARAAICQKLDYGRMRVWGSLAFIAASSGGGWLLAGRSPELVVPMLLATGALTVGASWMLPSQTTPATHGSSGSWTALAARRLLLPILAASLIQASHGVLYVFGSLHWHAAGYGKGTIGWLWAAAIAIEVVLFAAGGRLLRRHGPVVFLLIGALAGVLRWSLAAATTELWVLVIIQLLHAGTFAAAHLAIVDLIAREAPPGLANTVQGLYAAAIGIAMGTVMLVAGPLYEAFGGGAFLAMTALSGVAAGLTLLAVQRGRAAAPMP
jgi:MFS transporter, PPP family, 3-phenylpropionic acid transporter